MLHIDPTRIDAKTGDGRIPPEVIADLGRTLFGPYWQKSFAKAMKTTERTVQRWTNDGCPATFAPAIRLLLTQRNADIGRLQGVLAEIA